MSLFDELRAAFERIAHRIDAAAKDVQTEVMLEVREELGSAEHKVEEFLAELKAYGARHPGLIFGLLRRLQPILVLKNTVLVTRFEDVEEVLSRDDVFDVQYEAKMRAITDGENFFLGMRDGARYERDKVNARAVARRSDLESHVVPRVTREAELLVAGAPGRLDAVSGLCQLVPARLVAGYFGTPGPDERTLIEWASTLFWFLFLDPDSDAALRQRALEASRGLNAYLDAAIVERKRQPRQTEDVLGRYLALQAAGVAGTSDLDIRNNLVGLVIGAIPTTATAAALALDELLRRPEQLEGARAAARSDDDALLGRYVNEALRFNPFAAGIFRTANQDFVLAKGELRATKVPAGATVIASTQSAMFDALRIDDADQFRIDRPLRDYLHFGYGLHTCFGYHINQLQIPLILKPLLAQKQLRRLDGDAGQLKKSGPFAGELFVAFD